MIYESIMAYLIILKYLMWTHGIVSNIISLLLFDEALSNKKYKDFFFFSRRVTDKKKSIYGTAGQMV